MYEQKCVFVKKKLILKRVLEASREEGQRIRRVLAKEEGEVKKCEEELARAREDTKVHGQG